MVCTRFEHFILVQSQRFTGQWVYDYCTFTCADPVTWTVHTWWRIPIQSRTLTPPAVKKSKKREQQNTKASSNLYSIVMFAIILCHARIKEKQILSTILLVMEHCTRQGIGKTTGDHKLSETAKLQHPRESRGLVLPMYIVLMLFVWLCVWQIARLQMFLPNCRGAFRLFIQDLRLE